MASAVWSLRQRWSTDSLRGSSTDNRADGGRPVHAPLYIHSVNREIHHIEVSAIPLTAEEEITGVIGIFWRTEEQASSTKPEP